MIPSLAAWALLLVPMPVNLWAFGLLFAMALLVDSRLRSRQLVPPWWCSLRWPLPSGMAALLALQLTNRPG